MAGRQINQQEINMVQEAIDQVANVRKSEGFNGQRAIVLPDKVIKSYRKSALISNVFITDIGFYPKAKFHYRERETGTPGEILIYCVDGKGWIQIDGKEIIVERDQFIIIPAMKSHKYGSDEKTLGPFIGCTLKVIWPDNFPIF